MVDVHRMIMSLRSDEIERLLSRGPDQILDPQARAAIDRAAGGPGEGRGYYVVRGPLWPAESREYHLRGDVVAELFTPASNPSVAVPGPLPE